ncbi:MAG: ROK family protein [Chloroflexi bacterium]|nr:ROK family protein [Chloroflexota bacterium]
MTSSSKKFAIGIDIGATKIASVLLSEKGDVIAMSKVATLPAEGMQSVFNKVAQEIKSLMQSFSGEVIGVGIGSPGKVDTTRGVVYDAVNLGWKEANLLEGISRRIDRGLPIWVGKDTNLSALGEYFFGNGRGYDDFVYASIGSGLGGGIISGGQLITGSDWYAADLGHISIDPNGLPCVCGNNGCAETIVSGAGLVELTKGILAESSVKSLLRDYEHFASEDIILTAQSGDELALFALSKMGQALGVVLSACTAILNPSRFIIGGGLGVASFNFIVDAIDEEIRKRTMISSRQKLNIVRSNLETPAVGSACLAWYMLLGNTLKKKLI